MGAYDDDPGRSLLDAAGQRALKEPRVQPYGITGFHAITGVISCSHGARLTPIGCSLIGVSAFTMRLNDAGMNARILGSAQQGRRISDDQGEGEKTAHCFNIAHRAQR